MKTTLPTGCKLSQRVLETAELMPRDGENYSITDAQYAALDAGLADGKSLLISAPTSTGKTLIGWWAAATGLEHGKKFVYLVSHRALASQKFDEIQKLFRGPWLGDDPHTLVCATGDGVTDGSGRANSAPLSATILVATYEKYLALISAGGPPQDLSNVVFVCDEIQLIGDGSRGKHVELLLSVLKRTGWYQFIGLSAVMDDVGAQQFAHWLDLSLVKVETREKSLTIEGRWRNGRLIARSTPDGIEPLRQLPSVKRMELNGMVQELIALDKKPVIVFCMKVDDCYELAAKWAATQAVTQSVEAPAGLDLDSGLLQLINKRCAFHNAELSEAERSFVEDLMEAKTVDVVFATSTLAAGVNFPLGSAVFSKWKRWDFDKREHVPIRRDEFQNMAGRVGRMGQGTDEGIVLATAGGASDLALLQQLMDFSKRETLGVGITPADFGSLVIQLFAGGLCTTRNEAFTLMAATLSASREAERGVGNVEHWRRHLDQQIDRLIETHCLIETKTRLVVTEFGKAVARSGLKPETVEHFLHYLSEHGEQAAKLLPTPGQEGRDDDLLFIFAHGSLLSPEFTLTGGPRTRNVSYRFSRYGAIANPRAEALEDLLFERPWIADPGAANGARALSEWAAGADRETLEQLVPDVRLGLIESLARDVSWLLAAVSEVIGSSSSPTLADAARHPLLRSTNPTLPHIRKFSRVLRRYAVRIGLGLPSECHWLKELELRGPAKRLTRMQIVSLHQQGISRPHLLMDGSPAMDALREAALPKVGGIAYANQVRDAARNWKVDQRRHFRGRHEKKAVRHSVENIVSDLYDMRGKDLEAAVIAAFEDLGINCTVLDDGTKPAWPDLKIEFSASGMASDIVAEVKSKERETALVSLNDAIEVISAAAIAGLSGTPVATICSPGVEPSVPTAISGCNHLSVVELVDLAEAYLRIKDGNLTIAELHNWLTTPGIAITEDLPFNNS
ncbi:DEAD/DEAH box helicase (plasmid) [Cereibacter azotoformans]|uniref:DEAD/DEAH box helicase n=1 Tax=Cereibacter azotoformans TaxID=43057 RepID=UPI000E358D0F|nr:DEAD/DEAH box helicase [Cereibacter azotoformans]AXQ96323.1 DEAD/DEAH box helicase [Cereibacter sphaeroides]UIJ33282.1 DEAD/DEAH box helicase [Cereibacter azotoformans]